MSDRAFEEIKMAVVATFPEAYVWDTGRGGFDIIDARDKDAAMSVGYGKTEFEAWAELTTVKLDFQRAILYRQRAQSR